MTLEGKVALVTGGARGIGAATSKLLARRGAKVVVNYLNNAEAAEQVVSEIKANGGEAIAVQADVRDRVQIDKLVEQTKAAFGRLDILVSNANMRFAMKSFTEMRWDEFSQKLNDELKAAFETTQAVVTTMIEQKYGRIVYISSGLGANPSPNFIAHGSAKAVSTHLSNTSRKNWGLGITANVVSPGIVETDATAHMPTQSKQMMANFAPLRRIATPDDIAGAVAFFASDDSGFLTGTNAPVNGGSSM